MLILCYTKEKVEQMTNTNLYKKQKIKRAGYSIKDEVLKKFNQVADEKGFNKSKLIENYMMNFIQNKGLVT